MQKKNNVKFDNIIILDSHYRTKTFFEAFKDFKYKAIFINRYEKIKAIKNYNLTSDDILDLSNFKNNNNYFYSNNLSHLKIKSLLHWNIDDIINSDRRLSKFNREYAFKYIYWVANKFYNFILEKKISKNSLLFLEPTWSHELVISQISKSLGLKVIAPLKCKLFKDKFYFFEDWKNEEFYSNYHNEKNKINSNFFNQILLELKRSSLDSIPFFNQDSSKNKINLRLINVLKRIMIEKINFNRNKHIHESIFIEIMRKSLNIIKYYFYKNKKNFWSQIKMMNSKKYFYIYIPLHYQPEASINVIGYKYTDQLKFITAISSKFKNNNTYKIIVKEHPHCLGNRSFNYYSKLKKLNNVILLNPLIDSRSIIKKSNLVISIAGTASLEAAILKIPSITSVKMYFSHLLIKDQFDCNNDNIYELINSIQKWKIIRNSPFWERQLTQIFISSFEGNFGDYESNPKVLEKENILKLRKAIKTLLI